MKTNIKTVITLFTLTFIFSSGILLSNNVFGQDGGDDPDDPGVPLDGGLSLLLAAGAAYGGKKVVDYRKKQKKN